MRDIHLSTTRQSFVATLLAFLVLTSLFVPLTWAWEGSGEGIINVEGPKIITKALQAMDSLEYGLRESTEKVNREIKELPLKLFLSTATKLMIELSPDLTRTTVTIIIGGKVFKVPLDQLAKFTIAKVLAIGAEEVTEEIVEKLGKDKNLLDLYSYGGIEDTLKTRREQILKMSREFAELAERYDMNQEFIKDFEAYLDYVKNLGESYTHKIDELIKQHNEKELERNLIISTGGIALIIVTAGASAPVILATRAGYFVADFISDIWTKKDFLASLLSTWHSQVEGGMKKAEEIESGLKYILEKMKKNEPLPSIQVNVNEDYGSITIVNRGATDVTLKISYIGEMRTIPYQQTYVPPVHYYGAELPELTLKKGQRTLFPILKPLPDIVTQKWLEKATGYGLSVEERGVFKIFYGEEETVAITSASIVAFYKPHEFKDKNVQQVLITKGTMPVITNNLIITLEESGHKLYIRVYDNQSRFTGFDPETNSIKVGIPNSYYFDLEDKVMIVLPGEVKIEKIVVDASKAKETIEEYKLAVVIFKEGKQIDSAFVQSSIKRGEVKDYTIEEIKAPKASWLSTTPLIVLGIIIAVFVFAIRWKRKHNKMIK